MGSAVPGSPSGALPLAIGNSTAAITITASSPTTPTFALVGNGLLTICLILPVNAFFDSTTPIRLKLNAARPKLSFETSSRVLGYSSASAPIAASTVSSTACSLILRMMTFATHSSG